MYATEARSYALVGAGVLATIFVHEKFLSSEKSSLMNALSFWLIVVVTTLSHLSYLSFYGIFCLWSLALCWSTRQWWKFSVLHGIPILLSTILGISVLTQLSPGSGPIFQPADVVVDSLSYVFGGPALSPSSFVVSLLALFCAIIVGLALIRAFVAMYQKGFVVFLFYFLPIIILPLFLIFILEPKILLPRYFYPSLLISSLLLSQFLAKNISAGGIQAAAAWGVIAASLLGNSKQFTCCAEAQNKFFALPESKNFETKQCCSTSLASSAQTRASSMLFSLRRQASLSTTFSSSHRTYSSRRQRNSFMQMSCFA
jgi:hypothetical protein